jgi:hypothetical protein
MYADHPLRPQDPVSYSTELPANSQKADVLTG